MPRHAETSSNVAAYLGAEPEFESAAAIYQAAKKTTDHGYSRVDAHTPFPVHGMDAQLRQGQSHLGWICAACGLTGVILAQLMMWWMNAVDYPIWVSGKRPYDWPPTVPITFEVMVLLASFGAVFGMLMINKLPRWHHPIFSHSTIHRASDDRFFLSVESSDPMFDADRTTRMLTELGGENVELVQE